MNRTVQIIVLNAILCAGIVALLVSQGFTIRTALVDGISLLVLLLLMTNLLQVVQRYYHSRNAFNPSNIAFVVLLITVTVVFNYLSVIGFGAKADTGYPEYLEQTLFYRIGIITLLYFLFLSLFWMDQQHIHEQKLKEFAIEKERESVHIEINSIQQQFKPHFLFNSLNSINALTLSNPEEARKMIQLLSEFMRGSVKQDQEELISLKSEIRHLNLYTDIEKVRFGSRLTVNYEIPDALLEMKVPALILQPIIENAIKYGLYGHTGNVTIDIRAHMENKYLVVMISNPFDEITQETSKGTGYGLRSIERKMLLIYGQSHLLTSETQESTYITRLKLPQA